MPSVGPPCDRFIVGAGTDGRRHRCSSGLAIRCAGATKSFEWIGRNEGADVGIVAKTTGKIDCRPSKWRWQSPTVAAETTANIDDRRAFHRDRVGRLPSIQQRRSTACQSLA
ncbi:hypothetical protein [Geobacillus vulcani]|uniref:hypothetical protein n=1 Tax=Geobacillus vulcani TaxID=135517 RepID=UPI0012EBA32E|nr:hypothetical protein [Geobacillus vulcani]